VYAIIDFKGFQYKVVENEVLRVPLVDAQVGERLVIDRVLLVGGDGARVGTPVVDACRVEAEVLGHGRGAKVVVGKFKRHRDYHRKKGHRQDYTELKITRIAG
jgi:large subunit ribosomal protein L21